MRISEKKAEMAKRLNKINSYFAPKNKYLAIIDFYQFICDTEDGYFEEDPILKEYLLNEITELRKILTDEFWNGVITSESLKKHYLEKDIAFEKEAFSKVEKKLNI